MKDWSKMRHVDIYMENDSYDVGDVIASIEGNSFGDKIIHYRIYTEDEGFKLISSTMYHEGNHPTLAEIMKEGREVVRGYKNEN